MKLFMIISNVKIIAFQTITNLPSFWTFYIGGKLVVYIINRKIHACFITSFNTRFISRVEHDFSVQHSDIMFNNRNKSGIFVHPCFILYVTWFLTQSF